MGHRRRELNITRAIRIDGSEKQVALEKKNDGLLVTIDGQEYIVRNATLADGVLTFFINNHTYRAIVSKNELGTQISLDGRDYFRHEDAEDEAAAGGAHHHGDGSVEAPMPGNIVAVNVKPGDTVSAGDSLVILESMKMQNDITAPVNGEVRAVNCKVGDQVAFGQILAEIQA